MNAEDIFSVPEDHTCYTSSDWSAIWVHRLIDIETLSVTAVKGQLHEWRSEKVLYRSCSFSIEGDNDTRIRSEHDAVHFLFFVKGKSLDTKIADHPGICLQAGEFAVFYQPAGSVRTYITSPCPHHEVEVVSVGSAEFFNDYQHTKGLRDHLFEQGLLGPFPVSPELCEALAGLKKIVSHREPYRSRLLSARISEVIVLALETRYYHPDKPLSTHSRDCVCEKIQRVAQLLSEHPGESYSLKQLAEYSLTNPTSLKTKFKQNYGCTVFEYLLKVRMQKALELLEVGNLPIAEIATMVGYRYPTHFTAAFRKYYGILPTQARRKV